jgi:hypothetical protein
MVVASQGDGLGSQNVQHLGGDEALMGTQRLTITLVFALMLASGWVGLHLAERGADRAPDPYPQPIILRR